MLGFSDVVKAEMEKQKITVSAFADRMGFSDKYIYDLLKGRNGSRWNINSMEKACEILGIEISFKSRQLRKGDVSPCYLQQTN